MTSSVVIPSPSRANARPRASLPNDATGTGTLRRLLRGAALAALAATIAGAGATCDAIDAIPWEAGESDCASEAYEGPRHGFAARLELAALRFYVGRISPASIPRCLFAESCSSYATRAVRTKGSLLGVLYVIDRYFYRENPRSRRLYVCRPFADERGRMDDSMFLRGGAAPLPGAVSAARRDDCRGE